MARDYCKWNHELTDENTYPQRNGTEVYPSCKICRRESRRRYRKRNGSLLTYRQKRANRFVSKLLSQEPIPSLSEADLQQRFVINRRSQGCTLEEIGDELQLTRERIRQIESEFLTGRKR